MDIGNLDPSDDSSDLLDLRQRNLDSAKKLIEADNQDFTAKCHDLMQVLDEKSDEEIEAPNLNFESLAASDFQAETNEQNSSCQKQRESICSSKNKDAEHSGTRGEADEVRRNDDSNMERPESNDETPQKKQGIVIQIVKDKGNLKMKQISNPVDSVESPPPSPSESNIHIKNGSNFKCERCKGAFKSSEELLSHKECEDKESRNSDALFFCDLCKKWKKTLKELLGHVKNDHTEIEIPEEYEKLLYKQRKAILNIERTTKELISLKKFKAVTRLLNSSKTSLENLNLDLFGHGDVNVFQKFINVLFTRIKKSMTKKKLKLSNQRSSKKLSKRRRRQVEIENGTKNKRKTREIERTANRNTADKNDSSGFSSDDDICLINIVKEDTNCIKEDSDIVKFEMQNTICLQFYAVPVADDGRKITLSEIESLRFAVKRIWNDENVDLQQFSSIKLKRYEKEFDEVLPDDTIFCGYLAKRNRDALHEAKMISELFNDSKMLSDRVYAHDAPEKITIKKSSREIKSKDSSDEYDDGFNEATAYLAEHPDVLFRNRIQPFKGLCKICGDHFTSRAEYHAHIERHKRKFVRVGDETFSCRMCGTRLNSARVLVHYEKSHRYAIRCEVCGDHFDSFDERAEHFKLHDSLTCGECRSEFDCVFALRDHFQDEHTERTLIKVEEEETYKPKVVKYSKDSADAPKCKICSRKFTSLGRLQQHNATAHLPGVFTKKNSAEKGGNPPEEVKFEVDLE